MSNIKVTSRLLLDLEETAQILESAVEHMLMPVEQGVYIKGNSTPSLIPGRTYYRRDVHKYIIDEIEYKTVTEVPVIAIEDITGDVFDINAIIVIPDRRKAYVSTEPSIPVRGIAIIMETVSKLINDSSAYAVRSPEDNLNMPYNDFLLPQYREDINVVEFIMNQLLNLRTDVQKFIGDDKWIMHFHRLEKQCLFIEKTIDFRIHSFMVEHGWKYPDK